MFKIRYNNTPIVFNLQVPLGVLLLNENRIDEMVQILQHIQKYIPTVVQEDNIFIPSQEYYVQEVNTLQHKVLFSGNQLTFARVIGAQIAMSNANNSVKRLHSLIPVIQDWHTEVIHVCEHQSFMYKLSCFHIGDLEIFL